MRLSPTTSSQEPFRVVGFQAPTGRYFPLCSTEEDAPGKEPLDEGKERDIQSNAS